MRASVCVCVSVCGYVWFRMAIIRRRLRKADPFRPVAFAKTAQQQFVDANAALQKYASFTLSLSLSHTFSITVARRNTD